MEDMEPYICLFQHCDAAGKTYRTFAEWQKHLRRRHIRHWKCHLEHDDESDPTLDRFTYETELECENHLIHDHPELNYYQALGSVGKAAKREVLPEQCFVCLKSFTKTTAVPDIQQDIQRHIASHLQTIFILALPWRDDIEPDDMVSSNRMNISAGPDLQNTHDHEAGHLFETTEEERSQELTKGHANSTSTENHQLRRQLAELGTKQDSQSLVESWKARLGYRQSIEEASELNFINTHDHDTYFYHLDSHQEFDDHDAAVAGSNESPRDVVNVSSPNNKFPNKSFAYTTLGSNFRIALADKYSRTGALAGLLQAITELVHFVLAISRDHPDRGRILNNLNIRLGGNYRCTKHPTDSMLAAKLIWDSVPAILQGHPASAGLVQNFSRLQDRYKGLEKKDIVQLEETIQAAGKVIIAAFREYADRDRALSKFPAQPAEGRRRNIHDDEDVIGPTSPSITPFFEFSNYKVNSHIETISLSQPQLQRVVEVLGMPLFRMAASHVPKRYALLVGVDLYPSDGSRRSVEGNSISLNDLQGCVNDALAMQESLAALFSELTILTSSPSATSRTPREPEAYRPTFNNIRKQFNNVTEKTQAGDLFLFYFSGYGAQLARTSKSPARRTTDPSLLTLDYCCGQPAVRGWQLNEWLHRLHQKGVQIVVILDSCHSGPASQDGNSFRTPSHWMPPPNLASDEVAVQTPTFMATDLHDNEISWDIDPAGFTIMAACEGQCLAREICMNRTSSGLFTQALVTYLKCHPLLLISTYREICEHIAMDIAPQIPQVFGRDRLTFLGTKEP